jgi:hypothetical protein
MKESTDSIMEEEECFDDLSFYEKKMAGRYVVSK